MQSEVDGTSVTKLIETKMSEGEGAQGKKLENIELELVYSPHVFAEYEIVEEKLGASTKLELVSSTHKIVIDLLQLQIQGKPPQEIDGSDAQFLDEATSFEYLQRGPKRELVEYVANNRIVELDKGKFLYIGCDDASAIEDYFNKLLHFWQYQRAHQEPHKVAGFKNSDVSRFEASFQGNLNRIKEFKTIRNCVRFYAPYWIAKLQIDSGKFFVFDFKGVEQARLGREFTTNPDFYNFIRSKMLSVGD
ncbi:MAG: hypothetical protein HMLIMOIP_000093 [Candidatus Nitrosomirales archaeon]